MKANTWIYAILAMALAIVGCAKKEVSETIEAQGVGNKVRLISWSEYFDPEVFKSFAKETGIEVEYITFEDPDELEARLASEPGAFDLVVTDDLSINRLAELHLLQPLDKAALPHSKNIAREYMGKAFDPGNEVSLPYLWGTTLIAFRSDKIEDPGESWKALWNEEYAGKAMVFGDRTEGLGIGLIANQLPINSSDPKELDVASDALLAAIKNVGMKFGSDATVRDGLESGEIWIASCYSGDAAMVAEDNENVSFFIPKEGAPLWMDNFSIPSDARNVAAAHALIDYMLRPEPAAMNANFTWYGSTNREAEKFISEELLADESVNPSAEVRARCQFYYKSDTHREVLLNAAWGRVQEALRLRNKDAKTVAVKLGIE
ncbi:MAG: spermidine/putrescine ABC transporter substrate-binding protein [Verrucomicrobiaceae bacterium]|nr:spermidine/putrescine ABC transporter substrate-binding protein [Verrucomicrobiaceae bacterium]